MIPIFKTDSYKLFHKKQYPEGTTRIYSTLTARNFKFFDEGFTFKDCTHVPNDEKVVYGLERALTRIDQDWYDNFVCEIWEVIESQVKDFDKKTSNAYQMVKIIPQLKQLHKTLRKIKTKENNKTGEYLKTSISEVLEIKYLPDYTKIKENTVVMEIINKKEYPEFFWLVNYLEVQILEEVWAEMTAANIARNYCNMGEHYADLSSDNDAFVKYQFHDFSQRGISSSESALRTGAGHLAYLRGTDNLQAAWQWEPISANDAKTPPKSIPATEHSVMCINENEVETMNRLLDLYPTGSLSVVADGFNIYNFVENVLPAVKDKILEREGKLIIRPDSGKPWDIIFGTHKLEDANSVKQNGILVHLDKIFGHTINKKGYRVLNSHIGIIYGDGITFDLAQRILYALTNFGWSSENITFGIGAYTYQHITRDTLGFAFKSSAFLINNEWVYASKHPITDPGKKSWKGFTAFHKLNKTTTDGLTYEQWEGWHKNA